MRRFIPSWSNACSCLLLVAATAAAATTTTTETQQQQPKCRGLKLTEFIKYLQTEAGVEFDLSPTVAERENMSMEQLIGRAQGMWEGATRFEYGRALQAEADGHSNAVGAEADGDEDDGPVVFPYILCSNDIVGEADKVAQWGGTTTGASTGTGTGQQATALQRKKSGFGRRLLIQEAIANATSQSERYRDGGFDGSAVVLKDMFNDRGTYCAVASLPGSIAMALEFDGCVVQPMLLATKLGAGTVTLAVAIVNKFENSTKIDMDVPDDLEDLIEEQVHGTQDEDVDVETPATVAVAAAPTERKFPGVTISLCPGFLSADDVFNLQSGRPVKQKKVQRIMTEWLLSKTADGEDTTDRIKQNLYWTSSSRESASTTTDRGRFWGKMMDRVSEPNACAKTFTKRLTWYLEPGLSESAFTNLHVSYDNRGASKTDHDCILVAIAGFSIHPDICFFEFNLEKTPQIEYQQHLRSSQQQTRQQHTQKRRERATHRPNADWMVQSYVEQARPFFDAGINGTGVVVAVSDTGLDADNCYFHDATNPIGMSHRKIVSYDVAKGDGSDYEGGHGTVSTRFCLMHSITSSFFTRNVNIFTHIPQSNQMYAACRWHHRREEVSRWYFS